MKRSFLLPFLLLLLIVSCRNIPAGPDTGYNHPEWSKSAVIYEVNIRQYTPGGTFNEFSTHIDRLKNMGVGILWLMPVNPIGEKNRKGSLGSYYSVRDYMKVNPEYGTMEDFKNLVKKAHNAGMKVIIDWVANHTSWDNPLITEHPEFYKKDSSGKIIAPVPDWTDVAQLDYNVPALRDYMKDAMLFWIKEADIDGFRCDVAGMVPIGFWNKTVPELRKQKDIFMLAEAESPEMHDTAFDMTYSWDLFHLMKNIYKGDKSILMIDSLFAKETSVYDADDLRMRFVTNHDENSWAGTEYELFGNSAEEMAAFTFLVPGMPLIYSGQEAGLNKRLRFFDKDTINWNNLSREKFYKDLISLKKEQEALFNGSAGGSFIKISNDNPSKIYSFLRKKNSSEVLSVFNFSPEKVTVTLSGDDVKGNWKMYNSGVIFNGNPLKLELQPWGYVLFTGEGR